MSTLAAWTLAAILSCFVHPDAIRPTRSAELARIAVAIADASEATPLPDRGLAGTAALLVGIAKFESGFRPAARGKLGEIGLFQLLGNAPSGLEAQAEEAIHRWSVQSPTGYTGEHADWTGTAPLAVNRSLWGLVYEAAHPFPGDGSPELARQP